MILLNKTHDFNASSFLLKMTLSFVLLMSPLFVAQAKVELYKFSDPQVEADYKQLINELRCLVCQNQNLADSNAELAQDLRKQVVEQLNKGSSREQIVEYMVNRYGDFVMYRPPFKMVTALLWLGPLVFFLIALVVIVSFFRGQKTNKTDVSDQQKNQAHSLLDDD